MSLKTWMKEFYKTEAPLVSKRQALAHSLLKWIGLRKENLAKHGILKPKNQHYLDDPDCNGTYYLTTSTCALCVHYYNKKCVDCPLALARDGVPCYDHPKHLGKSPYVQYVNGNNPEPMIALIQLAIDKAKSKKRTKP